MKNKILYGLFLITLSIFLSINVDAAPTANACNSEKNMAVLQLNEIATDMIRLRFSTVFPDHGTTYYQMALNGRKSMCVSQGKTARSGNKYKFVGPATDRNHIMGYGYYVHNGYATNSIINWAISQSVTWYGINTDKISKIVAADNKLKTPAERMGKVAEVIGTLSSYAGGSYYYWDNYTIPGGQRMISDLSGCEEKREQCPSGTMVKSGEIGACYVSKGGNDYLFSNVAVNTQSDQTNIHSQYGKRLKRVGKYCSLFCQEYGEATLPGATGEPFYLGSYIIWPTSSSNYSSKFAKNAYPLKFKGKLKCKLGVQPDDEMPGDYDACHLDPIYGEGQYNDSYIIVKDLNLKKDFHNSTWEDVRKRIGRTQNPGGACKAYYDLGGAGCSPDEKCLTPAETKLREAETAFNNAQTAADNVNPKTQTKYCTDPKSLAVTACGTENTADYQSKLDALETARGVLNRWRELVAAINAQISTCTRYIENFENACNILQDMYYCGAYQIDSGIYDFSSNVSMWYADEEYETGDVSLESSNKEITRQGTIVPIPQGNHINDVRILLGETPPIFAEKVKQIKANEYEVTADETYTLSTGYSYIDKETLKYKTSPEGLSNYINIRKEVIPTSYNNKVGVDIYKLSLNNISFGSSMSNFGVSDSGEPSNYVCKQGFNKGSDLCICPENTVNAGKSLSCMIRDTNKTCVDAQMDYCEDSGIEIPEDCDLYCDPPLDYVPISTCINDGYTAEQCKAKCIEPIKCKDPSIPGDITSCVQIKIMQGKTKQQAIDICDPLLCSFRKTIIYRTIKLENPFPGKSISRIATGFNNDVKGRFPGVNWISKSAVYSKIRNNRGVSGTTIYNTKKPLYTFTLNGVTIKKIREYNDRQEKGYNDFNLVCTKNKSSGCISSFVHDNSLSGITDGTCQNISLNNGFYTCDD